MLIKVWRFSGQHRNQLAVETAMLLVEFICCHSASSRAFLSYFSTNIRSVSTLADRSSLRELPAVLECLRLPNDYVLYVKNGTSDVAMFVLFFF